MGQPLPQQYPEPQLPQFPEVANDNKRPKPQLALVQPGSGGRKFVLEIRLSERADRGLQELKQVCEEASGQCSSSTTSTASTS